MTQHTQEELLAMVNAAIEALDLERQPARLYEPIRYTLTMGGKRIRPVMCLTSCELFGVAPELAIPVALSLELFHNFTLLHDDIMDKAEKRRNLDCVHIKWNENVAILSGDAMQIMAFDCLRGLPEQVLRESVELFNKTALEVCEGQQFDMDFEEQCAVTDSDYLNMIRLKTGVLLAASLKLGAIAAGANPADADKLYEMGIHMGIAFQLQDDLLDVYGDTATFGKNIGGDITTNKKTYLLIQALKQSDAETHAELIRWISTESPYPEVKIAAVTAIYDKTGVKDICREEMERHYRKALECLDAVSQPAARKEALLLIASQLMNRTS